MHFTSWRRQIIFTMWNFDAIMEQRYEFFLKLIMLKKKNLVKSNRIVVLY